jgi:hypothetical protein
MMAVYCDRLCGGVLYELLEDGASDVPKHVGVR